MTQSPSRGQVWQVDLGKPKGHEQGYERPALVVSVDEFNHGPAGLVVVLPISKKFKGIPWHVSVSPPEGGLDVESFIKCEDVRSISKDRLIRQRGTVAANTFEQVEERLKILFKL